MCGVCGIYNRQGASVVKFSQFDRIRFGAALLVNIYRNPINVIAGICVVLINISICNAVGLYDGLDSLIESNKAHSDSFGIYQNLLGKNISCPTDSGCIWFSFLSGMRVEHIPVLAKISTTGQEYYFIPPDGTTWVILHASEVRETICFFFPLQLKIATRVTRNWDMLLRFQYAPCVFGLPVKNTYLRFEYGNNYHRGPFEYAVVYRYNHFVVENYRDYQNLNDYYMKFPTILCYGFPRQHQIYQTLTWWPTQKIAIEAGAGLTATDIEWQWGWKDSIPGSSGLGYYRNGAYSEWIGSVNASFGVHLTIASNMLLRWDIEAMPWALAHLQHSNGLQWSSTLSLEMSYTLPYIFKKSNK